MHGDRSWTERREASCRIAAIWVSAYAFTGCMATTGAVTGLVTGPVSCIYHSVADTPSMIIMLPLSIPLGSMMGYHYGKLKDRDCEQFGTYWQPGTYRIAVVFDPLRGFPKGPDERSMYPGPDTVPPLRRSTGAQPPSGEPERRDCGYE